MTTVEIFCHFSHNGQVGLHKISIIFPIKTSFYSTFWGTVAVAVVGLPELFSLSHHIDCYLRKLS